MDFQTDLYTRNDYYLTKKNGLVGPGNTSDLLQPMCKEMSVIHAFSFQQRG